MSSARYWHGGRLLVSWIVGAAGLALFRWTLEAGTYRGAVESREVTHLSGIWPSAFAGTMTIVGATLVAASLVWATGSWFVGRRERAARRSAAAAGHRRVLM